MMAVLVQTQQVVRLFSSFLPTRLVLRLVYYKELDCNDSERDSLIAESFHANTQIDMGLRKLYN